jgi:hypothetical protein
MHAVLVDVLRERSNLRNVFIARRADASLQLTGFEVRKLDSGILPGSQSNRFVEGCAAWLGVRNGSNNEQQQRRGNRGNSRNEVLAGTPTSISGVTTRVQNIEPTSPKAITLASGDHMVDPDKMMGVTPTAAAIDVRQIGRNRRSPASSAACSSSTSFFIRSWM